MFWMIFTQILACTPWYDETEITTIDTPTEAKIVQSYQRYFWFTGTKVIFLPYLGCQAKVELITLNDSRDIGKLSGESGFIQRCPDIDIGELISNDDGTYLAYRLASNNNTTWHAFQQTETGLLPVLTPPGFSGTPKEWQSLSDALEDPASLLKDYEKGLVTRSTSDTEALLELVKTMPLAKQQDFLHKSVDLLNSDQWIEMFTAMDTPHQEVLLDELVTEFMAGTTDMNNTFHNVDSTDIPESEQLRIGRMLSIRERLIPVVQHSTHADFLKRVIDSQYFPNISDFQIAHAKYASIDPSYTAERMCPYILDPDPHLGQAHTAIAMVLIGDHKVQCTSTIEEIAEQATQAHINPCCDDSCIWKNDLVPREQYIQKMQQVFSSGKISEPIAVMSHLHDSVHDDNQKDGYTCALHGTPPYYGIMNHWSIEWTVNGTVAEIDTSIPKDVLDSLMRNFPNGSPGEVSQHTYLPATQYQSGDVLGCTLTVTKIAKPSLDKIIATKRLGPSRTYVAESVMVP